MEPEASPKSPVDGMSPAEDYYRKLTQIGFQYLSPRRSAVPPREVFSPRGSASHLQEEWVFRGKRGTPKGPSLAGSAGTPPA